MQVIQKTLLAFGVDTGKMKVIWQICSDMGIKAVKVESEEEAAPLGLLAGARNWMNPLLAQNQREMKPLTEEMLVFAGFSDEMLETFLKRLRQNQAGVSLKAVLTEQNAVWNAGQLQGELKQEREAFLKASLKR